VYSIHVRLQCKSLIVSGLGQPLFRGDLPADESQEAPGTAYTALHGKRVPRVEGSAGIRSDYFGSCKRLLRYHSGAKPAYWSRPRAIETYLGASSMP
jgi:hypothetical protein